MAGALPEEIRERSVKVFEKLIKDRCLRADELTRVGELLTQLRD